MKSYRKAPRKLFLKQQGVPKRTFLDIKNVIVSIDENQILYFKINESGK
jgi:hypothetical protein